MQKLISYIVTGIFLPLLLIPFVFIGIGIYMTISQHTKIQTYEQVQAEVVSTDIEHRTTRRDRRTRHKYTPIVHFKYTLDGKTYTSDDVTPLGSTSYGSRAKAASITRQFEPGSTVTAYYNPNDPSQAFLIKRYSFGPYLFILFPLLILVILFWISIFAFNSKEQGKPKPAEEGGYEIDPGVKIEKVKTMLLWQSLLWWIVLILALGHFFYVRNMDLELKDWIISAVVVVIGFVMIGFWIYYANLCRNLKEARLLVDRDTFRLGDTIRARIMQEFFSNLQVDKMSLQLKCTEIIKRREHSSKKVIYEYDYSMLEHEMARPGETLFAEQEVSIPDDQPPSTDPKQKGGRRHTWEISINTMITGAPDYRGRFPILINAKEDDSQTNE